jgi:hypothetical protein
VVGVIDRRPAPRIAALAVAPGAVGVLALATDAVALALGLAGLVVLAAGTFRGRRAVVTFGAVGMLAGPVYAGLRGGPPGLLLLATAGTVVAWTTGQHVVGLADQLGRDAPVTRSVLVHLGGATAATLTAGGLALAVYVFAAGAVPLPAVAFLLVGAGVLILALEP